MQQKGIPLSSSVLLAGRARARYYTTSFTASSLRTPLGSEDYAQRLDLLQAIVDRECSSSPPWTLQSRLHPLRSFPKNQRWFVKRDDELGGISLNGSKRRKYASLLPFLLREKEREQATSRQGVEVVVLGGAYSNNVLGLTQLLREHGLTPTLFLCSASPGAGGEPAGKEEIGGNLLFTSLFLHGSKREGEEREEEEGEGKVVRISRQQWTQVNRLAAEYKEQREREKEGRKVIVLPEGAFVREAFAGMLSLPLDLLRNEREQQQREQHAQRAKTAFHFRDVFVDSGTGMSAAALILALDWLHRLPFTRVHVLLLAGSPSSSSNTDEEEFLQVLNRCQDFFLHQLHSASSPASSSASSSSFERWTGSLLKERGVRLYRPVDAPSFGSVNQSVLRYVAEFARREGILLDPVYSAKLFRLAEEQGRKKEMQTEDGGCVVIHSGGALALSGFQKRLARMTFL